MRRSRTRLRDILARTGLPTEAPRIGAAKALELMQMDKKVLAGALRLVLLEKLGRAIVTDRVLQSGARRHARGIFRMSALAPYAALEEHSRGRRYPEPQPATTARNISAIAIASSTPPRSAGWSTRPRCSSITKAICTGRG